MGISHRDMSCGLRIRVANLGVQLESRFWGVGYICEGPNLLVLCKRIRIVLNTHFGSGLLKVG